MNPGILRESITFKRITRTSDGAGGHTATYATAFTVSAAVKPKGARTITENGQLILITPYEVTIRYAESQLPTPDMLISWRGNNYLIQEVNNADPLRMYVKILMSRG